MDRQQLYAMAKEAGFKVEAGKYNDGTMVIEGNGGLCEASLAKFMELVADMCSEIAHDGGYNCLCQNNILRQMHLQEKPDASDVVDFLNLRVLKEHGGSADPLTHHFNLTKGDSLMHLAASSEIQMLRRLLVVEQQKNHVLKPCFCGNPEDADATHKTDGPCYYAGKYQESPNAKVSGGGAFPPSA